MPQLCGIRTAEAEKQNVYEDVLTGRTALKGEGVRIVVDDMKIRVNDGLDMSRLLLHERHLLFLVNELFAAGAEGIAVNGERIVTVSSIRCVGPAIRINDANTVPPYEVVAIGKKGVLKGAIMMMGGVVDSLSLQGMIVEVMKEEKVEIEPYRGEFKVRHARPE